MFLNTLMHSYLNTTHGRWRINFGVELGSHSSQVGEVMYFGVLPVWALFRPIVTGKVSFLCLLTQVICYHSF